MSEQAMQAIANAISSLQHAHQILAQAAQYGQGGQIQAGNPSQQAYGNPNGMQGAVLGQQHQPQPDPQQLVGQYGAQGNYTQNPQGFSGGAAPQTGFGIGGQVQGQQQQVTPEMIQTLIAPLVQNDATRNALSAEMNAMGITNLPDARPDQLPELYQRFTRVRDSGGQPNAGQQPQHFGNGAAPQQQAGNTPNPAAPSII